MNTNVIGIDLAKSVFHLVLLNSAGKVIRKRKLRRNQLAAYVADLEPCLIAMEACGGAHHWARTFQELGYQVSLLPPQHVKGYLRGQKNDYNDALAIAEAATHSAVRSVAIKTIEQQDAQALHRIRRQLVGEKTRLTNQVRGLLAEYGIVIRQGDSAFRTEVVRLIDADASNLSPQFRNFLARQYQRFLSLEDEIKWYKNQLQQQAKSDEVCNRLSEIPGFGPIISSAFKSWIGTGRQFNNGREASAALGLIPRQQSTGGKPVLLGISKRGDSELRSLLIHGARSVARRAVDKTDRLSLWFNRLASRRGFNKAVVALANKLVRMGWVIVARGEKYQPAIPA